MFHPHPFCLPDLAEHDFRTFVALAETIRRVAVALARADDPRYSEPWTSLPFRLVPEPDPEDARLYANMPLWPAPVGPARLRWRPRELPTLPPPGFPIERVSSRGQGFRTWPRGVEVGLFLSRRQRDLLDRFLATRPAPGWSRSRLATDETASHLHVHVAARREPEAAALVRALVEAMPLEVAETFEEVRLLDYHHEAFVLTLRFPGILNLVRDHPQTMLMLIDRLARHGRRDPGTRQALIDRLLAGLRPSLASTGAGERPGTLALVDRLPCKDALELSLPKALAALELTPEEHRFLTTRRSPLPLAGLRQFRRLRELGLSPRASAAAAAAVANRGETKGLLPENALQLLLFQVRDDPDRARVLGRRLEQLDVRGKLVGLLRNLSKDWEGLGPKPFPRQLPEQAGPWRFLRDWHAFLAVRERFQNCLLTYAPVVASGKAALAVRDGDDLPPLLLMLDGGRTLARARFAECEPLGKQRLRAAQSVPLLRSLDDLSNELRGSSLTSDEASHLGDQLGLDPHPWCSATEDPAATLGADPDAPEDDEDALLDDGMVDEFLEGN